MQESIRYIWWIVWSRRRYWKTRKNKSNMIKVEEE
jgi:hypothetical protein